MDRQPADIITQEKQRRDHVAAGRHHHTPGGHEETGPGYSSGAEYRYRKQTAGKIEVSVKLTIKLPQLFELFASYYRFYKRQDGI